MKTHLSTLLVAATLMSPTGASQAQQPHSGSLELGACDLPGAPPETRCGTYRVYEDREAREGRTIDLFVAVLPATGDSVAADALTYLRGGPGAPALSMMGALQGIPAREHRDIVLVDQRGTGRSNGLRCEQKDLQSIVDAYVAFQVSDCDPEVWDADLRLYTTSIAMDDLDEIRAALGYDQWTIWGGSYGTRAALEYVRRHGEHVRAVLLSGVAPMGFLVPLHFSADAAAALEQVFEDCAADEACRDMYPDLDGDLHAALERLDTGPVEAVVEDPRGGSATIRLTRDHFTGAIRSALYSSNTAALLPRVVHAAGNGDFAPAASVAAAFGVALSEIMYLGMTMAVICAEDAPWITMDAIEEVSRGTPGAGAPARHLLKGCDQIPRGEIPAGYHEPVSTDVPILLASGDSDPVTGPRWAEAALPHLENARHVVFANTGHGIPTTPCGVRIVHAFVETADPHAVDASCAAEVTRPDWAPPVQ